MKKIFSSMILLCFIMVVLLSCTGLPSARLQEARVSKPHSFLSAAGVGRLRWTLPFHGTIYLEGVALRDGNSLIFQPDSAYAFWNWSDGYSELSFVVEGEIVFSKQDGHWVYAGDSAPELLDIAKATIRYKDTVLRGEEARRESINRQNRLRAFAGVLATMEAPRLLPLLRSAYPRVWFTKEESMHGLFAQRIFPEVYGRSVHWAGFDFASGGYARGRGVQWSLAAGESQLPPELRELRSSGTLFRDYEEALEWLYLEWIWDSYFSASNGALVFDEIGNIRSIVEVVQ